MQLHGTLTSAASRSNTKKIAIYVGHSQARQQATHLHNLRVAIAVKARLLLVSILEAVEAEACNVDARF